MTKEQKRALNERLQTAAEQQPEIKTMRHTLLQFGGIELVARPMIDPDLPALIDHGFVMNDPVSHNKMREGQCHENVAELWLQKRWRLIGVGIDPTRPRLIATANIQIP